MTRTMLIAPQIIPARAIPEPVYWPGSALMFLRAMNPVITAASPTTNHEQHRRLTMPQTRDTTARVLFWPPAAPAGGGWKGVLEPMGWSCHSGVVAGGGAHSCCCICCGGGGGGAHSCGCDCGGSDGPDILGWMTVAASSNPLG